MLWSLAPCAAHSLSHVFCACQPWFCSFMACWSRARSQCELTTVSPALLLLCGFFLGSTSSQARLLAAAVCRIRIWCQEYVSKLAPLKLRSHVRTPKAFVLLRCNATGTYLSATASGLTAAEFLGDEALWLAISPFRFRNALHSVELSCVGTNVGTSVLLRAHLPNNWALSEAHVSTVLCESRREGLGVSAAREYTPLAAVELVDDEQLATSFTVEAGPMKLLSDLCKEVLTHHMALGVAAAFEGGGGGSVSKNI